MAQYILHGCLLLFTLVLTSLPVKADIQMYGDWMMSVEKRSIVTSKKFGNRDAGLIAGCNETFCGLTLIAKCDSSVPKSNIDVYISTSVNSDLIRKFKASCYEDEFITIWPIDFSLEGKQVTKDYTNTKLGELVTEMKSGTHIDMFTLKPSMDVRFSTMGFTIGLKNIYPGIHEYLYTNTATNKQSSLNNSKNIQSQLMKSNIGLKFIELFYNIGTKELMKDERLLNAYSSLFASWRTAVNE